MAKSSEAQIRASAKYSRENTKRFSLEINKNTQADVLGAITTVESKQGYIVSLVRSDIYRKNNHAIKYDDTVIRSDNTSKHADIIHYYYEKIRESAGAKAIR